MFALPCLDILAPTDVISFKIVTLYWLLGPIYPHQVLSNSNIHYSKSTVPYSDFPNVPLITFQYTLSLT